MASSHNQSIAHVGSENRPLMLERDSYVPWSSRFMRYIYGKKDYGKMFKDSIENDPYQMKEIIDQGNLKLDADLQGVLIDQTKYRSMIGGLMYLTSSL
ncbi:hypothetical protein Tco_1188947 [Tanacetum coccineum]